MSSELVHGAAIASTSVIMGLVIQSTVRMQGDRPTLRFGMNNNRYISYFALAVIISIETAIAIAAEWFVVYPWITTLYEQNAGRIAEIFAASALGFFLNIWRLRLAERHRIRFALLCILAGYLLFNGLQILPP